MFWNNDIAEGIEVFIIFLGLSSPIIIIGLIYYLKKRLEHKQILAAIEKGTSLAKLKPVKPTGPLWIKNLTAGIALLIIAVGLVCIQLVRGYYFESFGFYLVAIILFAFGIARLIRGLLQRKTEKQSQTLNANTSDSD
jgi:uncharacterized membrane protein YcjF (UPF0283 family)